MNILFKQSRLFAILLSGLFFFSSAQAQAQAPTPAQAQAPAPAQMSPPSAESCHFYRDLQNKYACSSSQYLREVNDLCEKYLQLEPTLGPEIGEFFPAVRLCLQIHLQAYQGSQLCENLDAIAINSHLQCYLETGYCHLSFVSKLKLAYVMGSKIFQSPWRQTGYQINEACKTQN